MLKYCIKQLKANSIWSILFWIAYFVSVSLPLHASNAVLTWITIKGNYTIIHVFITFLVIISCIKTYDKSRITIRNTIIGFFITSQVLALFNCNSNWVDSINDFARYYFAICFLILACTKRFGCIDLETFFYISLLAMFVNCTLNAIMVLTKWKIWGLQYYNFDNRTGGGYFSLLSFLIPYATYCLFKGHDKIHPLFLFAMLTVAAVGLSYAKNRTTPVLIVLGCWLTMTASLANYNSKGYARRLLTSIVLTLLLYLGVSYFLKGESDLATHFRNTTASLSDDSDTLYTRIITVQYYLDKILHRPEGYGFGTTMTKLYQEGLFDYRSTSYDIDTASVTFGFHVGLLGMIVYICLLLAPIPYILFKARISDERSIVIAGCYILLLFAVTVLTSQGIHCYPVSAFLWTFIGLIMSNTPYRTAGLPSSFRGRGRGGGRSRSRGC